MPGTIMKMSQGASTSYRFDGASRISSLELGKQAGQDVARDQLRNAPPARHLQDCRGRQPQPPLLSKHNQRQVREGKNR